MPNLRFSTLLLSSVLAGAGGRSLPADVGQTGGRIEFDAPADWRCAAQQPCITCHNVSDHVSAIVIVQPDAKRLRHEIAGGSALQICSDDDSGGSV